MTEKVYKGFELDELSRAYDLVSDPDDWKAPIDATVSGADIHAVVSAIEFYTATDVNVSYDGEKWKVKSVGYRAGPAGP